MSRTIAISIGVLSLVLSVGFAQAGRGPAGASKNAGAKILKGFTEAHAKYLAGLDTPEKQLILFRKIAHGGLNVEDTEKEVRRMGGTKAARIKINYQDKDKEFALRQFFGAKVEIKRKGKGGEIIIYYFSDEELGEIVGKVKR